MQAGVLSVEQCQVARTVIERYGLHDQPLTLPVSIKQVARDEGWVIRYAEGMAPLFGVAVVYEGVKVMLINADISAGAQRATIAHEMGHVLLGHDLPLDLTAPRSQRESLRAIQDARQEAQAWAFASMLLIPDALMLEGYSPEEMAAYCHCPTTLAERRLEITAPTVRNVTWVGRWRQEMAALDALRADTRNTGD